MAVLLMAADGMRWLVYERGCRPALRAQRGTETGSFTMFGGPRRDADVCRSRPRRKRRQPHAMEQRRLRSELGRQVTVDLQADADFDESRRCPGHDSIPNSRVYFDLASPNRYKLNSHRS